MRDYLRRLEDKNAKAFSNDNREMTDDRVEMMEMHTVCRFHMKNGETITGCTCQITEEVEIVEGEIDSLGNLDEDCPHKDSKDEN